MNIHHLELFYYVAKHGGITEGVRKIPYGLQQPAMSSQIIQLEQSLGVPLFRRRPFALTAAGCELYDFIRPFFEGLESTANRLRGGLAAQLRIGASGIVLREYLPEVLTNLRRQFPQLKVSLRDGYQPQLEEWIHRQEIDLAITLLEGKPSGDIRSVPLFPLPLILLVPKKLPLKQAEALWKLDRIEYPLVSLPSNESICRHFQQGLARLGVDWFTSVEVSSLELVQTYVASGAGVGLSIAVPRARLAKGLRAIPLEGFEPVRVGLLMQQKTTPVIEAFAKAALESARQLRGTIDTPAGASVAGRD